MPALSGDARTARLADAYVTLSRERLPALLALYDKQAVFKDPFNNVQGRVAIDRIFSQMFDELVEPRFSVLTQASEGDDAFLTWVLRFHRGRRSAPMEIRGATHLRFNESGLVVLHRDYWDAAEELYEKLPVLSVLMRALRRRLAAG